MLLSHTVLLELYQEKLVTENEVERMKGERDVQFIKPPEVVARAAIVLEIFGHKGAARLLKGW